MSDVFKRYAELYRKFWTMDLDEDFLCVFDTPYGVNRFGVQVEFFEPVDDHRTSEYGKVHVPSENFMETGDIRVYFTNDEYGQPLYDLIVDHPDIQFYKLEKGDEI